MLAGILGKDNERRAEKIVEELNKTPQYDIICLQEVFDEDERKILDEGLKSTYNFRVIKSSDHDIFNDDSGLFFASKYKILDHNFVEFNDWAPFSADRFSDKGIFSALIDLSDFKDNAKLLMCNTHLQSSERYDETRAKQLSQIQRYISKRCRKVEKEEDIAVMIAGDFNVIGDVSQEYRKMISLLGYPRDLFRMINTHNDAGYTWDGTKNTIIQDDDPEDMDKQRLDYIFTYNHVPKPDDNEPVSYLNKLNCSSSEIIMLKDSNEKDLSDHYGVDAVVSLI